MTGSISVSVRLLGSFGVEAGIGRPCPIAIKSRKARALVAYLAMKPDYQASREELATLLWGDNPDAQARHSLRQCLTSLRQDLLVAPDLLVIEREAIGLRPQLLAVDAGEFVSLAGSAELADLGRAAKLCRGEFLADLTLDLEEFDGWRRREADRLRATTAHLCETLARIDDRCGNGDQVLEAAERSLAFEPTRERTGNEPRSGCGHVTGAAKPRSAAPGHSSNC
jgi:DNA-binding SARP family transcriptional activator